MIRGCQHNAQDDFGPRSAPGDRFLSHQGSTVVGQASKSRRGNEKKGISIETHCSAAPSKPITRINQQREKDGNSCQVRAATKAGNAHIPHKPATEPGRGGKRSAACGKTEKRSPTPQPDKPFLWPVVSQDQLKNEISEVLRISDFLQLSVSLASDCCAFLRRLSGPSG